MRPVNNHLNHYWGHIGQNNAAAAPPQAEPEHPPAHGMPPNPPPSRRHFPNWLRSVWSSRNPSFDSVSLRNRMATAMRFGGCDGALIDQFKRYWALLGKPHPDSLYA